jgi:hypothetical protein
MPRSPVVALLSISTLAACGGLRPPVAAPDPVLQARLQSEVAARLAHEPALAGDPIRVEVRGTTVLLHGSVHGLGAWQCALTNAGLVRGVTSVVDFLTLERGPRDVHCLAPRPAPVDSAVAPGA